MSLKTSQVLISVVLIIIAILSFVSLFQVLRHEESGNIRGGWSDKASSRERVLDQRNRAVSQYTKLIEDELQFAKQKLQQVSSSALSVLHHSSVVSSTEDAGLSSTHSSSSVIATVDDDSTSSPIDPLFQDWKRDVYRKLKCTYQHRILYYMYHARKAAGTTIRDVIKASNQRYFVSYEETEGRILNQKLLGHPQVFTVTTMREPISRILSLYWYEHVGWLHGVLHQTERCKPLREWVNAWQDGASYKTKILKEDPRSNYIEIENYYTKAFSNWDGHSPIGEEDFEKAKQTLLRFDMILISEWLGDETEVDAVNAVFSGRTNLVMGSKLKGNKKMQEKLQALLAADENIVREKLQKLNQWDIKLYDYAMSLVSWRLKHVVSIVRKIRGHVHVYGVHGNARRLTSQSSMIASNAWKSRDAQLAADRHICDGFTEDIKSFQQEFRAEFGIFRPDGHKGP